MNGNNGGCYILLSSATYTPPPVLTISAALKAGGQGTDTTAQFRGMGVGFQSYVPISTDNACNSGFQCMAINTDGTVALYLASAPLSNAHGQTEQAYFSNPIDYSSVFGAPYSTSNFYTISYTVNTMSGVISNISLSDGTTIDTADFSNLDGMVTTMTGAATAYAAIVNSGFGTVGYAQDFTVSGAAPPPAGPVWTGATNTTWATAGNWTGAVPGATSGTTNTDTATFNTYNSTNPTPVVDAGRNLQNITFDNGTSDLTNSLTLGTTTGNALLLTSGGTIQTTFSVANPMTVNAPLVLEGVAGTYTFTSAATSSMGTLNFGGSITPGATSGVTTLTLNGANTGSNTISGAMSDHGGAQLALTISAGNWVLAGANTYTGATTVSGGTLRIGNGTSGSLGATPISISAGKMIQLPGGSIGNTSISVSATGTFAVQPGSGTLAVGTTTSGTAGATLSLASGGTFSMVDGAIGTFNLQQQASFGAANTALTLSGGTLDFDLSGSGVDKLNVGVGNASVTGVNNIVFTPIGSSLSIGANYTLISAPAGGLAGGTFQFPGGSQSTFVNAGGTAYQLTLNNTATAVNVGVSAGPSFIIQDTFSTTGSILGKMPDTINLPGGVWHGIGVAAGPTANVTTPGTVNVSDPIGANSGAAIAINSHATNGSEVITYNNPNVLTISAAIATNISDTDTSTWRGSGLGFYAAGPVQAQINGTYANWNQCDAFMGVAIDNGGTPSNPSLAICATTAAVPSSGTGNVIPGTQNVVQRLPVNWSSLSSGGFSSSTFYTLSYTINMTTGVITNMTLAGPLGDEDFAGPYTIPGFNVNDGLTDPQYPSPANAIPLDYPVAYAAMSFSAIFKQNVANFQNFEISGAAAAPSGSVWTGLSDTTWANPGNWTGAVPGSTTGTTNTDTALFNQAATNSPTTIDAGRNVMNITFDTAAVSSMTIGTTTGPALLLSSGGTIQTTAAVANPQTVNAPIVLEGNYTFTSGATSTSATLSFGGGITPAATSGVTTLTLNGANTGANTISGVLADNGAGQLAVAVGGTSRWVYSGATSTYSGGTSIASGATLQLAGSVSTMSQAMNIANSGSLVVASSTNQKVGTITGTGGSVVVNSGSLTAYQIRQTSLTINGTSTVTLSPSGSGSTTAPAAPNNINFSSNVNSLTIAGTTNAWTGTLDIGNNGLVIQYGGGSDPYATIANMIESGYANGQWTGTGITSSLARAAVVLGSPTPALNIGIVDFVPNGPGFGSTISFEGQTISTSAVLVRLTYMDDLVLAGNMLQANATSDALFFAANYGSGTTWHVGDVTHDNSINTNDALLFAANYVVGLPSLDGATRNAAAGGGNQAAGSVNGGAVPEPSSIVLAALGVAGFALIARSRQKLQTVN